jgi:hypothetical protein
MSDINCDMKMLAVAGTATATNIKCVSIYTLFIESKRLYSGPANKMLMTVLPIKSEVAPELTAAPMVFNCCSCSLEVIRGTALYLSS